jgi:hypothetical protein
MFLTKGVGGRSPFLVACICCGLLGCGESSNQTDASSTLTVVQTGPETYLVDFQREQSGQLVVSSSSSTGVVLRITLGESKEDLTPQSSWLGQLMATASSASAFTSVATGFRYAQVVAAPNDFATLQFSVNPTGADLGAPKAFHSGDEELDRIWQMSVYTAELVLQDGVIFDGPKRDRDTFAGDTFVTAKTLRAAFGHASDAIVEQTISDLASRKDPFCPGAADVNCNVSYNGWWVLDLADLYRYNGDIGFLAAQRSNLLRILQLIQSEMENGLMESFGPEVTVFADWSPGMVHFGKYPLAPEAIKIGSMVDYMAFQQGSFLLAEMGDMTDATAYAALAARTKDAITAAYLDPSTGTFGGRAQTNAMAIYAGIATDPGAIEAIFQKTLSPPPTYPVSPYFNYFVICAMDKAGHHADAIRLIKAFWGSMVKTGATTFWEMYDPQCVNRADFHSCLTAYANNFESDGQILYVSLAHGWSSGPAAFLSRID